MPPANSRCRFTTRLARAFGGLLLAWSFVAIPAGAQEQPLYSNEVQLALPSTRFELMPTVAAEYVIDSQYGPPTLKPKG